MEKHQSLPGWTMSFLLVMSLFQHDFFRRTTHIVERGTHLLQYPVRSLGSQLSRVHIMCLEMSSLFRKGQLRERIVYQQIRTTSLHFLIQLDARRLLNRVPTMPRQRLVRSHSCKRSCIHVCLFLEAWQYVALLLNLFYSPMIR